MYGKNSSTTRGDGPLCLPESLPDDLRWPLADALSYQSCSPQDIWETVRDWMVMNGAATAPEPPHRPAPVTGSTKFTRDQHQA